MIDAFWPVVVDGAVLCAALGTLILGSLAYNPRLWLNDAPPRVRALAPPLTPDEQRARLVTGVLFLVILIAVSAWSAARLYARHAAAPPFAMVFAHFVAVFFLFNLFDLVVIDWLIVLIVRPRFLTRLSVPDLSYEETVGGYGYHFRAFIKGIAVITVFSLIAASAAAIAMPWIDR